MSDVLSIARALADEGRLRALCALRGGRELCVCQIIALLGLAPSTVSKHMSVLQAAGLVASRKEGRWVYYRAAGEEAPAAVREALDWVWRRAARGRSCCGDAARLQYIVRCDREELCRQRRTD